MEEKATVYVIAPDDAVRDSIQLLIETADLAVRSHASAASFSRIVPFPNNGCVLIDQNLPDMTGLEVVEHLRRRGVTLPVIVMTLGADPAMGFAAERFGALLLEKPFVPRRLVDLIQSLHGRPHPRASCASRAAQTQPAQTIRLKNVVPLRPTG
jgi:two-component system response regulator FixJ